MTHGSRVTFVSIYFEETHIFLLHSYFSQNVDVYLIMCSSVHALLSHLRHVVQFRYLFKKYLFPVAFMYLHILNK